MNLLERSSTRFHVEETTNAVQKQCCCNPRRRDKQHIAMHCCCGRCRLSIHFLRKCPTVAIHTRYPLCWVFFLSRHRNHGMSFHLWNLDKIQSGMPRKRLCCCQTYQCRNHGTQNFHQYRTKLWCRMGIACISWHPTLPISNLVGTLNMFLYRCC